MKKGFISFVTAVLLGLLCVVPVSADVLMDGRTVLDYADCLSQEEYSEILQFVTEIEGDSGVVLVTESTLSAANAQDAADTYFNQFIQSGDGILFYVCINDRKWAISKDGECGDAFTNAGVDFIMEDVQEQLSADDFSGALMSFAEYCEDFIKQAETGSPYDAGNLPSRPLSLLWIPGSILIGCVVSLVVMLILKSQLTSVAMQDGAAEYVKKGSMKVRNSRDIFLYRKVQKTKKEQNNSKSGSGVSNGASGSF